MHTPPRSLPVCLTITAVVAAAAPAAAGARPAPEPRKIVIKATFESYSASTKTITYSSSKGTYSATWIGVRHYRLRGTITGRRFRGKIRTWQRESGTHYRAKGSGRLGSRRVRIGGGGPNNLRTATLILR